jgi:hypothetical protein
MDLQRLGPSDARFDGWLVSTFCWAWLLWSGSEVGGWLADVGYADGNCLEQSAR